MKGFFRIEEYRLSNINDFHEIKKRNFNSVYRFSSKGNLKDLLGLFVEDAWVDSPLYGEMKADDFYRELGNDTTNSE